MNMNWKKKKKLKKESEMKSIRRTRMWKKRKRTQQQPTAVHIFTTRSGTDISSKHKSDLVEKQFLLSKNSRFFLSGSDCCCYFSFVPSSFVGVAPTKCRSIGVCVCLCLCERSPKPLYTRNENIFQCETADSSSNFERWIDNEIQMKHSSTTAWLFVETFSRRMFVHSMWSACVDMEMVWTTQ